MTDAYTPWQLARLAEVSDPDRIDSPGALWLLQVARAADDDVQPRVVDGDLLEDAITEVADGLVPIYTHHRWQVFVDLAAYNEDLTDYGAGELTDLAGAALLQIAERLLHALTDEDPEEVGK